MFIYCDINTWSSLEVLPYFLSTDTWIRELLLQNLAY